MDSASGMRWSRSRASTEPDILARRVPLRWRVPGHRWSRSVLLALVATGLAAVQARAQDASLDLDLGASYSLPPAGGTGDPSGYLNGGLRLAGLFGSGGYFHLGGFGGLALRAEGASWASLLAGGGWLEPVSSTVALGVAVSGEVFTVGAPVPYRAAYVQAEPELRFGSDRTSVRLNGYGGIGVSEVTTIHTFVRDTRFGRRLFQVGFPVTSDLWAWGGGAELRQQVGPVAPRIGVEAYDSPQGAYVVGRLGLEATFDGGVFSVEGAVWDSPDGDEFVLTAGLAVFMGPKWNLSASGGRYGPDPLLDSPPGGSAGATMSMEIGRFGPKPEMEYEIGGTVPQLEYELGGAELLTLTLSLRAPDAYRVTCAGDFTNWMEIPMIRTGDAWLVQLPVTPGPHHFGFFVDGAWYVPPEAPGIAEDEWGGIHATLFVPEPRDSSDVTS